MAYASCLSFHVGPIPSVLINWLYEKKGGGGALTWSICQHADKNTPTMTNLKLSA